ncbi:mitotic checkpoint protein Mps1 [Acrasis kona]|uniref:Mitotic checkpoint protein Mps1 n=1 Tax=Acrasis kona TaxID=1008807 RepID=A0AAW2ZEU2_9EUKA
MLPSPQNVHKSSHMQLPPPPSMPSPYHQQQQQQQHHPQFILPTQNQEVFMVNNHPYTKIDIIGRGGSCKVYKCFDPDRKIVALKRVKLSRHDESSVTGFINEVELLQKLKDKSNIIQLIDYEVNSHTKTLSIIMECGQVDLNTVLRGSRGKLSPHQIKLYWQQMLEAVHTIHEARIVHGDLKPANFLLVQGTLKLIDFGIAKAIQNDTTNIVRDNQVGTPNYISPEALELPEGQKKYKLGRPSDIWSLGCILHQMIYGKTPFADLNVPQKIKIILDKSHKINFEKYVVVDGVSRSVDMGVIDVLKKTLVRDAAERATIPSLLRHGYLVPMRTESLRTVIGDLVRMSAGITLDRAEAITRDLVERLESNGDVHDVVSKLINNI